MVPNRIVYIVSAIIACGFWSLTQAELFTAIADCEPLLETHKKIIEDLDDYVQKEERRLLVLKSHLENYKKEHERAMEDIPNYLGNPINAFTLIKRLTTDLDDIEHSIKQGTEYIKNVTITHEGVKYPTEEDLAGAAHALTRLQATYKLEVKELAQGLLNGVSYSAVDLEWSVFYWIKQRIFRQLRASYFTSMSAGDCFELGRALYNSKDYKNSLPWMMEALRKYKEENNDNYAFSDINIMDYISFSYYLLDDVKNALDWTRRMLEVNPQHARARSNVPHYEKMLEEEQQKIKKLRRGETGNKEEENNPVPKISQYRKERNNYEALCRGEMDIPQEIARRLTCFYLTKNLPFLRLAPIKAEQRYIDPDVFIFYDVISDTEIEFVKNSAKPRFQRAVVHDPKTGELVPAHYRISKSAWLKDEESDVIARITRRVSDFTGLSMDSAEELQVVNYGIGGHYEPHFDFARKSENAFKERFQGNRIATVLFYMSEVAQGGATVFTELGLSVFPVKNAALFWLNLHPSGEGDLSTRHAACPVLRGSKWVSNKWIHQGGQELLKPCSLEYQREENFRKILSPVPKSFR